MAVEQHGPPDTVGHREDGAVRGEAGVPEVHALSRAVLGEPAFAQELQQVPVRPVRHPVDPQVGVVGRGPALRSGHQEASGPSLEMDPGARVHDLPGGAALGRRGDADTAQSVGAVPWRRCRTTGEEQPTAGVHQLPPAVVGRRRNRVQGIQRPVEVRVGRDVFRLPRIDLRAVRLHRHAGQGSGHVGARDGGPGARVEHTDQLAVPRSVRIDPVAGDPHAPAGVVHRHLGERRGRQLRTRTRRHHGSRGAARTGGPGGRGGGTGGRDQRRPGQRTRQQHRRQSAASSPRVPQHRSHP